MVVSEDPARATAPATEIGFEDISFEELEAMCEGRSDVPTTTAPATNPARPGKGSREEEGDPGEEDDLPDFEDMWSESPVCNARDCGDPDCQQCEFDHRGGFERGKAQLRSQGLEQQPTQEENQQQRGQWPAAVLHTISTPIRMMATPLRRAAGIFRSPSEPMGESRKAEAAGTHQEGEESANGESRPLPSAFEQAADQWQATNGAPPGAYRQLWTASGEVVQPAEEEGGRRPPRRLQGGFGGSFAAAQQ